MVCVQLFFQYILLAFNDTFKRYVRHVPKTEKKQNKSIQLFVNFLENHKHIHVICKRETHQCNIEIGERYRLNHATVV